MPGRVPGPIGLDTRATPRIDSGTAVRNSTPPPGGVGGIDKQPPGGYAMDMHDVGWLDVPEAARAIWDALKMSQPMVGALVLQQTGLAVQHILEGLIPALMMAIGVIAGTTVLGAGVGALIGALAGGVGAAPGAIIGGQLGYDLGMAAMALLGLGFLVHGIVEGIPQLKMYAERATRRAVNSLYVPASRRHSELRLAAHDYAQAQALLFKLVLMSLVALLLKKPTASAVKGLGNSARGAATSIRSGETVAAAEAGVAEIVAQLRASRLGAGFANWVEANWRELIENPRLRPQTSRTLTDAPAPTVAQTPSQLARRAPPPSAPPPAASPPRPPSRPASMSKAEMERISAMPKGSRPPPEQYLSREYIADHLGNFEGGASRFMTKGNLDKYGIAQKDGTSFVMPKKEADALLASTKGNPAALEDALGLPKGALESTELVKVDIPSPKSLGLRVPSGNEAGANSQWIPGGRLPTGNLEAVIDAGSLPPGRITITPLSF